MMKLFVGWVVFALLLLLAGAVFAQSQSPKVTLNPNGLSRIFPPFESEGWSLTRASGEGTHMGDDYFAQDWARDCFSQGQKIYAGISGSVQLSPVNDGRLDYYGNTVLIVDYQTGFAQRFAHLERFAPDLRNGNLILAGQLVGYVGATGNVTASAMCASAGGNGAHAHIALYKNIPQLSGRPVDTVNTAGGPSGFAAQFSYVSPVTLIKSLTNPTVYVLQNNTKIPVSAAVFASQGWNFDRNRILFDPLNGNQRSQAVIDSIAPANWFWPMRTGSLIKSATDPTVFLVRDGQRRGLPGNIFACRNYSFADVKTLPNSELSSHQPLGTVPTASTCTDELQQALFDFDHVANLDRRFGAAQLGTYQYDPNWDSQWDLRWMDFSFEGGQVSHVYHVTLRYDSSVRYIMYWDPIANRWQGWIGVY